MTTGTDAVERWPHWVGGAPRAPRDGAWIDSHSPLDGRLVARVADGGDEDVAAAVRSAAAAQPAWAATAPAERARVLLAIEAALRADVERLAALEREETGKPLALAREELLGSADYFGFYAAACRLLQGETFEVGDAAHVYTRREPFGVVAIVTPWNYAVNQAARGAAPALAAGNAVVLKPSEFTSTTTLALARLSSAAGLPDGLLNVVTGTGPRAGSALTAHPLVRRIAFTGSVAAGRVVAHAAAERLVPATLELGGKSPHLVFPDADLELAAAAIADGFLSNSGQTCSAGTRLLVHEDVAEQLVAAVAEHARGQRPGAELGPIITPGQHARVLESFRLAAEEGATALLGGVPVADPALAAGSFVAPTIYTDVTPQMRIAREEVFGPVLVVLPFADEAQALALADDTPYGLVAGVWTRDVSRALRVAARLQAGQVFVNGWGAPIEAPFGGMKESGYGREKGRAALDEYTQVKSVSVAIAPAA